MLFIIAPFGVTCAFNHGIIFRVCILFVPRMLFPEGLPTWFNLSECKSQSKCCSPYRRTRLLLLIYFSHLEDHNVICHNTTVLSNFDCFHIDGSSTLVPVMFVHKYKLQASQHSQFASCLLTLEITTIPI